MIGIFANLPDDIIKQIRQFIQPTPTAEIMKKHINKWTRKKYFHLWFRDHNFRVLNVLRNRSYKRMKYIKENHDDVIKNFKKRGLDMTIEKVIRRNLYLFGSTYEYRINKLWKYVE